MPADSPFSIVEPEVFPLRIDTHLRAVMRRPTAREAAQLVEAAEVDVKSLPLTPSALGDDEEQTDPRDELRGTILARHALDLVPALLISIRDGEAEYPADTIDLNQMQEADSWGLAQEVVIMATGTLLGAHPLGGNSNGA